MSRSHTCLSLCLILVCSAIVSVSAESGSDSSPDPFMGDWQGTLRAPDGTERQICAQVICWGRGEYQANLLDAFDQRVEPLAVLKGKLADGRVAFGETARIAGGEFTGTLTGKRSGSFRMKHVVRPSPTLGAKPPPGAIVLFDGSSLDEWERRGGRPWLLNLSRLVGGNDRVVYLRSRVWCPKTQPGLLEVGSDDGVKAWVNGKLGHANNVSRPVTPWEDSADVDLTEGWNTVMLKIVQGGGGFGACGRIRGRDGTDIEGLRFDPAFVLPDGADRKQIQGESTGTIVAWELAGPYTEEGRKGPALFDLAFAPEKDDAAGVEWQVVNDRPRGVGEWKLVEGGAMEITPRAGSMASRRQFTDHKVHIEFRTPFKPTARGQGRGNSGVYVQGRYELQVLDSYGLEGKYNECGAIYRLAPPRVNMCAPPLQWQTFDIELHAARYDDKQKKVKDARMTVYHNGVLIHDNVRIPARGVSSEPGSVASGGIVLQDHGNPVQYRNIWVVQL